MKPHYFEQTGADKDDIHLAMAKAQGYVPQTCLLCGIVVMDEVTRGEDACAGCTGPREKCQGRPSKRLDHFQPGIQPMKGFSTHNR